MKQICIFFGGMLFLSLSGELFAQTDAEAADKQHLTVGAEFRPRIEILHSCKVPLSAEIYPDFKTKAELYTPQGTRFSTAVQLRRKKSQGITIGFG